MEASERLIAFGFGKDSFSVAGKTIKVEGKTPEEKLKFLKEKRDEFKEAGKEKEFDKALDSAADLDEIEIAKEQVMLVDYPKPIKKYYLIYETPFLSIEPVYYYCMRLLFDFGFPIVDKITDIFTAAEHSSFYGAAAQRLGLAQDKVSTFLATIGKLLKDLFQIVRELRWIDERLSYYEDSGVNLKPEEIKALSKEKQEKRESAEIALKGIWVDMVDGIVGGQRTGGNIYTMAQQLQFIALPDLFFSIHPASTDDIKDAVAAQAKEFNVQVRNALIKKLYAFMTWKKATYNEMISRRKFTLNYLRQHFNVIKMYMNWVKPYLKHIERLQAQTERLESPGLISAFESSLVDIEILARHMPSGNKSVFSCLLLTFEYRTKPQMQFTTEAYHRGPVHVGEIKIFWREYAWTEEMIQNYIKMRDFSDLELLSSIDKSLKDAMENLGDDLFNYLKEAREKIEPPKKKEEEKKKKPINLLEPFVSIGSGFKELFGGFKPSFIFRTSKKPAKDTSLDAEFKKAEDKVRLWGWLHYKLFKKSHGMITW
ncbi:hypothetical protein DRJ22_02235 [Candidatus Woesearchaeota archaeon]|nr:MAG: hypothetical protein DRJ22_02235 [Candidatus Woesearchaeota archaeon]